ncbi:MAG: FkbM family methyltransferase, partial [Chloroflexota bacterium]
ANFGMRLTWILGRAVSLLEDKRALAALVTWPKFSLTSFLMVSRLARQGIAPRTVIDAGANVGQFAVAAAKLWPAVTVHSFEPNPASVARLRQNVSRLRSVAVYPVAVGDARGHVEFHVNSFSHSSSALRLTAAHRAVFPDAREQDSVNVEVVRLDDALADVELTPPVVLKLDVEGYEAKAIAGARRLLPRVSYVVVETCFEPLHEGQPTFGEIVALLNAEGFCFARPVDHLMNPRDGKIVMMDALFVRPAHGN